MKLYNTILFLFIFSVVVGIFVLVRSIFWDTPTVQVVFTPSASLYTPSPLPDPVVCVSYTYPVIGYILEDIGKGRISMSCEDNALPVVTISQNDLERVVLEKRKDDDAITQQLQNTLRTQSGFFWFSITDLEYVTSYLAQQLANVDPQGARYYVDNAYRLEYEVTTVMQEARSRTKKTTITAHESWAPFIYEFRGYVNWKKDNTLQRTVVLLGEKEVLLDPFGEQGLYSGYIDFLRAHVAHLE